MQEKVGQYVAFRVAPFQALYDSDIERSLSLALACCTIIMVIAGSLRVSVHIYTLMHGLTSYDMRTMKQGHG